VANAAVGYRFPKRAGVVALEVRNLFDQGFQFQDIDFDRSDPTAPPQRTIFPERSVFVRLALRF
jgi:hypothetical protein